MASPAGIKQIVTRPVWMARRPTPAVEPVLDVTRDAVAGSRHERVPAKRAHT